MAKQILQQFGFPFYQAPGEAEAECALLQRQGIVDAVLSEDVDTLMFGSGITIRNWSPEKTGQTPTHVDVYDAAETKEGSGMDCQGMILVALMSGGDYVPEGIPGCGPKTACEAARAGFGRELCDMPKDNPQALTKWRNRLQHELKTNESKHFKRKHTTLKIPDDFPRLDILRYYTHPVVSNQATLDRLRQSLSWDQEIDFTGLRKLTHDAFDWVKLEGAKHFIRSLAACLLVRHLWMRAKRIDQFPSDNIKAIQEDESLLVKGIHGKRQHPITDNSTELRVSMVPIELVKIDLSKEEPDDDPDALPPSSQVAGEADVDDVLALNMDEDDGPRKRGPTKFDPEKPVRLWVMETFVKVGVPLKVQDWEAERQIKLKPQRQGTTTATSKQGPANATSKAKNGAQRTRAAAKMSQAPIEKFAKVTKPGSTSFRALKTTGGVPESDFAVSKMQNDVIDLLSSPLTPQHSTILPPIVAREKSPSPPLVELPSSVTKRRRRGPIQRTQTLPVNAFSTTKQSSIPLALDTIETLDLVEPFVLSASQPGPNTTSSSRRSREKSAESNSSRSKQTTLDTWNVSITPKKSRYRNPAIENAVTNRSLDIRSSQNDIDTLDLTTSSPLQCSSSQTQDGTITNSQPHASRRKVRAPLTSVSSNALNVTGNTRPTSASSSCTIASQDSLQKSTSGRRPSSRMRSTASAPEILTSDSTSSQPRSNKRASSEIDAIDLTDMSPPPTRSSRLPTRTASDTLPSSENPRPECERSPKLHKSNSLDTPLRSPPRASRKIQEAKKRHIIMRKSLAGAWTFEDIDNSPKRTEVHDQVVPKVAARRKWRESEVEILDLT